MRSRGRIPHRPLDPPHFGAGGKKEMMMMEPDRLFRQAIRDLPASVSFDPLDHTTLDALSWTCRIQLDLTEEQQEGTNPRDIAPLRRWLAKWAPHLLRM